MKVLFDCVVTNNPPSKCSTTAQFVVLAKRLLALPGVFIYWPVPDFVDDFSCYPESPRIKYIKVHVTRDRMREYNVIRTEMEDMLSFAGCTWDWDVLVTVKTPQVANMRVMSVSPRQLSHRDWSKRIIVIEDMMVLSLKPTIAQSNADVQDRQTLEGYMAADHVLIPAYHEIPWVMEIARKHFSPARQKEIRDKLKEVCHLNMQTFDLKSKFKYKGDRKLNVAFIGRLEKVNARLKSINEILTKQFIFNGSKVNPVICTVSTEGVVAEDIIDKYAIKILHPDRQEFWRLAKEELDVGVFFHIDSELNMSMLEPVSFGMPVIVKKAPWSVAMFGDSYPFYVESETQAYAYVNEFAKHYEEMYAKFAAWYMDWFLPVYKKRVTEEGLYEVLLQLIAEPQKFEHMDAMKTNEVVRLLVEHGGEDFNMLDVIKKLGKTHLRSLASKVGEVFDKRGLVWGTPWNDFRLGLKLFYGFEDASTDTGHLRRKS